MDPRRQENLSEATPSCADEERPTRTRGSDVSGRQPLTPSARSATATRSDGLRAMVFTMHRPLASITSIPSSAGPKEKRLPRATDALRRITTRSRTRGRLEALTAIGHTEDGSARANGDARAGHLDDGESAAQAAPMRAARNVNSSETTVPLPPEWTLMF